MRTTFPLAIALLWFASEAAHAADLEVHIADVRDPNGKLMIQVLGSKDAFDGKAPAAASAILPANTLSPGTGEPRFVTDSLPPGRYAVRVMHDRNDNGSLDSNLLGMPTEPWGFSNDAAGSFGPPSFDDAAFELPEGGTSITIHLNH